MAIVPKFLGPDGVSRENFTFSTTRENRFFTGTIDSSVAELQVSIRGSAYSSDPDLVTFEGTSFTVPNPSAYPDGLGLSPGENIIEIRSLSTTGNVSFPAKATVYLVQEEDIGIVASPPTGISIEQLDGSVKVSITGLTDSTVRGYNFYASTSPGGGLEGYGQVNVNLVDVGTVSESISTLGTLSTDANIATVGGVPASDPLYARFTGIQEDSLENLHQTDYNERLEVPENVSKIRTEITVSSVSQTTTYSFIHNRVADFSSNPPTIPNGDFSSLSNEDPLYYVVTAVYYDSTNQIEIESSFSPEVVGKPVVVTSTIGSFPLVTRSQVLQDMSLSIFRSQPQVGIHVGTYTRDVVLDPFTSEAERLRFILDFLHRAQAFTTLLEIDDPNSTGESVAVQESTYKLALKQAFFLTEDQEVQDLIDLTFDLLSSKYGQTRLAGKRSRGEVTISTKIAPSSTITIPIGLVVVGGTTRFRVTQAASIDFSNIASFYNASTGRYSVRVSVEAEEIGEVGNLAVGQINQFEAPFRNLSVVNESDTFGGAEEESNRDLAIRVTSAIASVDTGTAQGYRHTVAQIPGVEEVKAVIPGNSLMQRDFDINSGQHKGGKVDLWVRGENLSSVTDNFAFSFEIAENVQFVVFGDPLNLEFKAIDSNLSVANPIIEMLDIPSWNFVFFNSSKGYNFNLNNVEIVDYNIIKLDSALNDPADVSLTDVILGDYRYRTSDKHYFSRQPVRSIEGFSGSVTGEVDAEAYALYHPNSPLQKGKSTQAENYVQVTEQEGLTIPSGTPIVVSEEEHVILGEYIEYVNFLGANPVTVRVFSEDRTVEYTSPYDPASTPDYTIIFGDSTNPLGIKRTASSSISSGETISIDYEHDENFTVDYTTNLIVKLAQEEVDEKRHITADIVVKEANEISLDLTATIVLESDDTTEPLLVGSDIRTNLTNYVDALGLKGPLRPSDVIAEIEKTDGVSYVELPLVKMVRGEGTQVIREILTTSVTSDVELLLEWSSPTVSTYLIKDSLANATTTGGGSANDFRGVFKNDVEMELISTSLNLLGEPLNRKANNAYIIGKEGLSIPGYTDNATLVVQSPFILQEDKEKWASEQRLALTANRILVALSGGVDDKQNENQTMTGSDIIRLGNLNIYPSSIKVFNSNRTTEYTKDEDFLIKLGGSTIPVGIQRTSTSSILSGEVVSVDYKYSSALSRDLPQNNEFTVTYTVGVDEGVKPIDPGETSYIVIGNLDFSYDRDR